MKHTPADLTKIEIIDCLYHRTFMSNPPILHVTVNGEKKEYEIRHKAAKRDKFYHSQGLNCVLVVYDNVVLAYEIFARDEASSTRHNSDVLQRLLMN